MALSRGRAGPTRTSSAWRDAQRRPAAAGDALFVDRVRRLPRGARHRRPPARSGPTSRTSRAGCHLAAGTLPTRPSDMRRWIADSQHVKPGNLMPAMRLTDAGARVGRDLPGERCGEATRCPNPLPRPAGELEELRRIWERPRGLARAHRHQQQLHRHLLRRRRVPVLRARRHPRAPDARAARRAARTTSSARTSTTSSSRCTARS